MSDRCKLSIGITSYNSKRYLDFCLSSIFKNPPACEFEVIVVDDCSSDGSVLLVKDKYPQVLLIKNGENIGYAKSNNLAIKKSRGQYVLSLNNDTEILPGALDELTHFLDQHPEAGAVGPKLINSDSSIQWQARRGFPFPWAAFFYMTGISKIFPKSSLFSYYPMTYIDDTKVVAVDSLMGACMLVRDSVISQAVIMDEEYIMYGEDIDWCYRIKNAGWKIYYLPQAKILHHGGFGGSRVRSYRNIYLFYRAMILFYRKHFSGRYFFLFNWLIYFGVYLKMSLAMLINFFRREKIVGTIKSK